MSITEEPRRYPLTLVVLILSLGILGCHALISHPKPSKKLIASTEAVGKDFKFSISGASSKMVATIVPHENREASYIWDKVPNTDSHIQMIRACNYYTDVWGAEPVTAERFWCWDRNEKTLRQFEDGEDFETVVSEYPDWIWIIANEPELYWQGNLLPWEYAEFFGWVAKTITNKLRLTHPNALPKLVFCQVASPDHSDWCEAAYFHLKHLVNTGYWSDWPEGLEVGDTIYALSTHNYIGIPSYGFMLEEERLSQYIDNWTNSMNDFVHWANTLDGGALADKPLWMTEFGSLWAFCHKKLEMRSGIDQSGGIGCPGRANRGNRKGSDDYVFYGRNNREGLWGLQDQQIEYFVNPTNSPRKNRGDWEAAWWYVATVADLNADSECDGTAWLFGDNLDCTKNLDEISRAGEIYRDTINCLINRENCPQLHESP